MTTPFQFTIHNLQFTTNWQLSTDSYKLVIASVLKAENCKLKFASGGFDG
jgi:hypothetical protein